MGDIFAATAAPPALPPDLRQERNLLLRFERDVELAGLVGEKQNAKVILLAAASAKLPRPLNVNVGGASAAGKNHLINAVARFIPDEDKKILTGMSPKVLMHSGEEEYQHKAVFIAEYEGVAGADYAIRTMQSEQVIEWEFVESSNQGIRKQKRQVKGPAAFIQATTRVSLHPENETRLLFIQMDESDEQTRAINERQAAEAERKVAAPPLDVYDKWHDLFRSLEQRPVRIPFATQLAQHFPGQRIRSRRDFPKLLGLIEASAFLHQHGRTTDNDGNIVAAPQDYIIARQLFEHCYYSGPDSKVGELLKAAKSLAQVGERFGDGQEIIPAGEFSVPDLMQKTGWGKSKTYLVVGRAEESGCVGTGSRWGRYKLLREQDEPPLSLPPKIRLAARDFRNSTGTGSVNFRNSDPPQLATGAPPVEKRKIASGRVRATRGERNGTG